ncbi:MULTISPECIES: hypothetical protein [unclassified Pseudomonas]|uniref:hypothetical protein n=1 Tax=unclassified Pseudomonas TaxID=196821 RepID=UPI0023B9C3BF|nr:MULTISPECIES: hypothetical protein [unclassified Pseudomonas]
MEFSTVQLGVDVATSLAILASAITFMVNQRLKARETKRRQLDESVRAVTVDEFQSALGELSGIYVKEIVERAAPLQHSVGAGLERLEKSLRINPEHSAELLESMSSTKRAMGDFINSICAYNYQIYPLLDSIEGGSAQIAEFRSSLNELMEGYNRIGGGSESLLREVRALATFCKSNPLESVDQDQLHSMVRSIIIDADYRLWVDTFIPDGSEDLYWACIEQGGFAGHEELLKSVHVNVIGSFYRSPERMEAQVLWFSYDAIAEARKRCKEFLTDMAAINYWLIRKTGDGETLPEMIRRYRSPEVFAVDSAIR